MCIMCLCVMYYVLRYTDVHHCTAWLLSAVSCPDAAIRGCSQMTSAFFGVSDSPWCICQPIISFWNAPWCFKLMTSFVNHPEPKMIIFRIQFISIRFNRICVHRCLKLLSTMMLVYVDETFESHTY